MKQWLGRPYAAPVFYINRSRCILDSLEPVG